MLNYIFEKEWILLVFNIIGELILNNSLMNYFNEFGSKINIPKCLSTFISNLIAGGELGILFRGFSGIINNNRIIKLKVLILI